MDRNTGGQCDEEDRKQGRSMIQGHGLGGGTGIRGMVAAQGVFPCQQSWNQVGILFPPRPSWNPSRDLPTLVSQPEHPHPLLYHYSLSAIPSTHGSDLTCPTLKRWPLPVPGGPSHPPPRVLSRDTLPNSATSSKHIRRPVVSLLQARSWRRSSHGVSGRDRSFGAEARESMMLAVTVCHYSLGGL